MVPIATWLDDKLGNGKRNPVVKKWWFDHEIVDGVAVDAPKGDQPARHRSRPQVVDPAKQKMAYYHASMMPAPDDPSPAPLDRKAGMQAGEVVETPEEARARTATGGARPAHYAATQPDGAEGDGDVVGTSPYK